MIGAVLRIGIDVAHADEFEAVRFDQRDHVFLPQIAVGAGGVIARRIGFGAVLDDAEHPVILEKAPHPHQLGIHRAGAQKIVHLAKDEDAIDLALQLFGHVLRTIDRHLRARAIQTRGSLRRDLQKRFGKPAEIIREALAIGGSGIGRQADIVPLRTQIGHQHARVPAARGHVVHHGHARLHLEEIERFEGVAVLVTGAILGPVLHGEGAGQRGVMGVVHRHRTSVRAHFVAGMVLSGSGRGKRRESAGGEVNTHRNLSLIDGFGLCLPRRPLTSAP